MDPIIYSIAFGVTGFLVAAVLSLPGEVLAWWPLFVDRVFGMRGKAPNDWNAFQFFIYKIAYGCPKCIAGQLAFWTSLLTGVNIGQGFVTVALSIFTAYALEKHYGS